MSGANTNRLYSLLRREILEYRNSLFIAPVVIAVLLGLLMLASVLLVNRISVLGDAVTQVLLQENRPGSFSLQISVDDDEDVQYDYRIERVEEPQAESDWNFSREWSYQPKRGAALQKDIDDRVDSFNPVLDALHVLMMAVLVCVSFNYLLNCLFSDRKDRSVLFWKSLPVSEWETVMAKLAIALVVAPIAYIALSWLLQLLYVLLSMLMVWRMDMDPYVLILGNIDFPALLLGQLGGWLRAALWVAPIYAWLLFASAVAKRAPFLVAVTPIIGLIVLEQTFLGSGSFGEYLHQHLPYYIGGERGYGDVLSLGEWLRVEVPGMVAGLLCAAALLWATVYLRRHRFEI